MSCFLPGVVESRSLLRSLNTYGIKDLKGRAALSPVTSQKALPNMSGTVLGQLWWECTIASFDLCNSHVASDTHSVNPLSSLRKHVNPSISAVDNCHHRPNTRFIESEQTARHRNDRKTQQRRTSYVRKMAGINRKRKHLCV